MKNILTISAHSFVDLITNSSSELFVCEGDKTIEAVKDILTKLVELDDSINGTNNKDILFTDIIKEPVLSKYQWNYYDVPIEIRDNYEEYEAYRDGSNCFIISRGDEAPYGKERYKELQKISYAKEKEFGLDSDLYKTNPKKYEKLRKEWLKARDLIWRDYNKDETKAKANVYKEFLKQNNFSKKEIARVDKLVKTFFADEDRSCEWYSFSYPLIKDHEDWKLRIEDPMAEVLSEFGLYMSYGINVKKGDIIIHSQGNNSIPWKLMDSIESYLNANRYHIG